MNVPWLWLVPLLVAQCTAETGASLRGAVEALQRRQRGHMKTPIIPIPDYEAVYEFVPPGYPENDYLTDLEDVDDEPNPNYIVKLLGDNERAPETYQYKIIKKKNYHINSDAGIIKESAFRERSHNADNDKLRGLFADKNEPEENNELLQEKAENDAEYALLLGQLWSKYKNTKSHNKNIENAPQGVVKLYKEKIVKKRYPDSWGPIAFKRKRSSGSESDRPSSLTYENERKPPTGSDSSYNTYDVSDEDKDDWREEYAIAFQPLDDDLSDLVDDEQYSYETMEKRFPVTKRSSGPFEFNNQKKRFAQNQNKHNKLKHFRSSSGTDPRIIKDLSKIFGYSDMENIKNPVKRNTDHEENSHDGKPPKLILQNYNNTQERHNSSTHDDDSHELHGHNLHHPGMSGKEMEYDDNVYERNEKPKEIRKKSIDWSDYFGIDKRTKKPVTFINDINQNRLKKNYFDTFNKEVIYPVSAIRTHSYVKRNYVQSKPNEDTGIEVPNGDKQISISESDSKLDNIDKKLKTMEGMIVDEALQYSNGGDELDSKKEQEMKEKLLSRLTAAYSLEKMRQALKEFKQSLQSQKHESNLKLSPPTDEAKAKRIAVKKEKAAISSNEIPLLKGPEKNDDFEDEQGAGHYLNGQNEQQFSEGYMGGSGRHRIPVISTAGATGSCPVLGRIIQRCRGVDLLAGDRGQLFLPLCSLHQICYLCGEAPPTTCDLVFLSEADTTCEGDMSCQRAARSALMALRELHDSLADELDGECEANPCLPATLKLNIGWQRALQR